MQRSCQTFKVEVSLLACVRATPTRGGLNRSRAVGDLCCSFSISRDELNNRVTEIPIWS